MDILEVGNPPHHCPLTRSKKWRGLGDPPCDSTGMNYVEWTTHFSLWVIMKAPVSRCVPDHRVTIVAQQQSAILYPSGTFIAHSNWLLFHPTVDDWL